MLNSVKTTPSDPAPSPTAAPSPTSGPPPAAGPAATSGPTSTPGALPDHRSFDTSAWQRRILALSSLLTRPLSRPRTRLAVIGVVLLVVSVLRIASSVWTLPLVIIGAVMVLVAWIGARLDGRFAVEWGETGTQLEFRAQIKAPATDRPAVAPSPAGVPTARVPTLAQFSDPDVIEGEGHTVEIDVAELKALIASAEAREARGATTTTGESAPAVDGAHADRPAA